MDYNELLRAFLQQKLDANELQDFGYLLIPNDAALNGEAMLNLKRDFKKLIAATPNPEQ